MEMKTVTLGNLKLELTPERIKRIQQGMNETQRKLDRELGYSADLQNAEIIESYRQHIAKLKSILKSMM
jgi:hypothetical protein